MLDEILSKLEEMSDKDKQELIDTAISATSDMKWIPNPGAQTEAYLSEADITYYGGAGGGGKTDWGLGLAFTSHLRSLLMRRKYTDLSGIVDRAIEINGSRSGFNGSPPPKLRTDDGRLIEFGAAQRVGDEQSWQGRPHDLIYIDEAAQFAESQIRFLMGWVRSAVEGQRCRVCLGSNPPLSEEGAWLVDMFAPWLDPRHHNPALPGELRWYVTDAGTDYEVPEDGEYDIIKGKAVKSDDPDALTAMSRTFIPAKLKDNPQLMKDKQYKAQQDALPEYLRAAIRDGNFNAARKDHELQLIPSAWIKEAQERWTASPPEGVPMCSIGVDVAQGGTDNTVLAPRHDGWYAPLIKVPGEKTPLGRDVAALVFSHRRDSSEVVIDMGGGYGGATYEQLIANIDKRFIKQYKGSESTRERTKLGHQGFYNVRAAAYYRFYEALDPGQPGGSNIALPPSASLFANLCSIRLYADDVDVIRLESKKNLVERIGKSPDEGDAVVMSWYKGPKSANIQGGFKNKSRRKPQVVMGRGSSTSRRR